MCITSPSCTMYSLPSSRSVAFGAGVRFGTRFEQLVPANGFGADEMFFEVGVDCAGGVDGACVTGMVQARHSSSPDSEERNQAQQR